MIMAAGEQGVASLNQVGAPRVYNFGVGEQLDNYVRPEGRQRRVGLLGKGAASPFPISYGGLRSAVSSPSLVRAEPRPPTCFHATQIASHLVFLYMQVATVC